MDNERKRALREEYAQRKPEMGIVCWQSGEKMWIAISKDQVSDHNSSLFQLRLGTWGNREMQAEFTKNPDSFKWSLLKKYDYKDRDEDHSEDLETLFDLCMEEYPEAQKMKAGRK